MPWKTSTSLVIQLLMLIQKYRSKINSSAAGDWLLLIFIAIVIWVSRFLGFRSFGLYEDDYAYVGGIINLGFPELIARLKGLNFAAQGRPIGFVIDYIAAWLGYQLAELNGVYIIAYIIVLTNAILFYFLLKRLLPDIYAKLGTLAYAVFPADTTQAFLTHALILQPSLTFFLIATHLYLSRKFIPSYLVITLSLLTYEVVFPVFLAVPLLDRGGEANRKVKLIKNFILLSAIFVIVYFLRKLSGEDRVTKIPFHSFFPTNVFYGPFISLSQYVSRPIYAWQKIVERFDVYGNLLPILILFYFCLYFFCLHYRKQLEPGNLPKFGGKTRFPDRKHYLSAALKYSSGIILVGFVLLFLSYLLTFTNPAFVIAGRGSRVHLAAVFGAAVIAGAIGCFLLLLANYFSNKLSYHLASALLATLFALLIAFGFLIQQSYKESWAYQQRFWSSLVEVCPDLSDGTNIFVEVHDDQLRNSTFIETLSWPTPFILELIYDFPKSWVYVPRVWLVEKDWHKNLKIENNRLIWQTPEWLWPIRWFWSFRLVNDTQMSNTILVKLTTNGIMRIDQADSILFKPFPSTKDLPGFPRKNLFHLLLEQGTS